MESLRYGKHTLTVLPIQNPVTLDKEHYMRVNEFVEEKSREEDIDSFTTPPVTEDEVIYAISKMHKGKAPGFDMVTIEHITYANPISNINYYYY